MRYSYEFKMECVELYRQGLWADIPEGVSQSQFKKQIVIWSKIVDNYGCEALKHKGRNKDWSVESKLELISKVLAGESYESVAVKAGINSGILYQWVRKYKIEGYNGLVNQRKGRPCKDPKMKKDADPRPLTESEREELIRLRAEVEYIKAENEVIKKEIALRHEKWAAQLKAKKQQSSKSSEKKDSD